MYSHVMEKNSRGNEAIKAFLIDSGEADNNSVTNSRIAAAATPAGQRMLLTNFVLTFRSDDQVALADSALPAGYYQFWRGVNAASGAVDGGAGFSEASAKRPFPAGTTQLHSSEQMRAIRSGAGEELFLVVTFYEDLDADTYIGLEADYVQQ